MAFHFVSHRWEVRRVADGIVVTVGQQDLDAGLDDELFELFQERGQPNLTLDLQSVQHLGSVSLSQLVRLHIKLRKTGNRLVLLNLNHEIRQTLESVRLTDIFDLQDEISTVNLRAGGAP